MKTNNNTTTRIPINDEYAAIIGKAVYAFSYYEWSIIYIIDCLRPGFVAEYSRPTKGFYTSSFVKTKLEEVVSQSSFPVSTVTKNAIETCKTTFDTIIKKRNALIHAHPITDTNGSQILAYQTNNSKPLSDIIWRNLDVEILIEQINEAVVEAGNILDILRRQSR